MSSRTSAIELWVWGPHAVEEALGSGSARIHEILVVPSAKEARAASERARARKEIRIHSVTREALASAIGTDKNQGIAARLSLDVWETLEDWTRSIPEDPNSLVVALDGVQDPQNLGAIIRSAHFFGAQAVLTLKDRSAPLTGAVAKASAGALFSIPLIRATNLARELEAAESKGFWRVGLDSEAEGLLADLRIESGRLLLVVGGEGEGLRNLTKKSCDALARLSRVSARDSLNASTAAAVALYEAVRQRGTERRKS